MAPPEPLSGDADLVLRPHDGHLLRVDEATSARMAGIRQSGTRPERVVRRMLTGLGIHYRLHNRDLPGSPDLANRKQRWALFVHGCYWHRHGCRATTTPKRNRSFWEQKFQRNVERDVKRAEELHRAGFSVVVVWECETKGEAERCSLEDRLQLELPVCRAPRCRADHRD